MESVSKIYNRTPMTCPVCHRPHKILSTHLKRKCMRLNTEEARKAALESSKKTLINIASEGTTIPYDEIMSLGSLENVVPFLENRGFIITDKPTSNRLEPRTSDREKQTADDDNTEGEDICSRRNAVNQRTLGSLNYNKEDPDLEYGNRIATRSTSSAVRQIRPENCLSIAEIPHQDLQNQAISSSTTYDTVNVSAVHEGCKPGMDYHFSQIIQDCMERVPQVKKMTCMQKVLSVVQTHTSA